MHILDLNTTWQLTLDPANQGIQEAWYNSNERLSENSIDIQVPSCWEEIVKDYEGVAWYSQCVLVPEDLKGSFARLKFAASNYRTSVWVNGNAVGIHEGGYTPFEMRVDEFLKFGEENHFAIRVLGPIVTQDIQIDDLGVNDMPHWRGGLTGGIWQSLSLEFNNTSWIESAFYKPQLENAGFSLEAQFYSPKVESSTVAVSLILKDQDSVIVQEITCVMVVDPGRTRFEAFLPIEQPRLWSPDSPHLYHAELIVSLNGETISRRSERIGLRAFTFENGRFFLNGDPVYLRGGFWEGVYAKHQSYPEDREVVRKEIQLAKDAGFNLLRPWRRPVPPVILEEADAAGMFIIGSPAVECMSCWPTATPEAPKRIENEIRQMILRDRNHACIIWWEMFNEVTRAEIARLIAPMSLAARELDPTRLILDESGGWADGAHFYLPYSRKREKLAELHSYVRAPVSEKHFKLYQNLGTTDTHEGNTEIKAGTPIFMSEFGFGGLPEIETNYTLFQKHGNPLLPNHRRHRELLQDIKKYMSVCGFDQIFQDIDAFCRASQAIQARGNRRQAEAILANPNISGYCIHAFTDGDWILSAGMIDHWQRPKEVYHAIAEANHAKLIAIPEKRTLVPGSALAVKVIFMHSSGVPARLVITQGAQSFETHVDASDRLPQNETYTIEVPAELLIEGANKISLNAFNAEDTQIGVANIEIFVVDPLTQAPESPLVIYDPHDELIDWRNSLRYPTTTLADWDPSSGPCIYLFASEDVGQTKDIQAVQAALEHVSRGEANAVFIDPPATHDYPVMLQEYDASRAIDPAENHLLKTGTFPFKLNAKASFSFWEASMHVAKDNPIFDGLPSNCMMDEPYQEVVPAESFCELEAEESPVQTITWFAPDDPKTKAMKYNYLGNEPLWYGTDLATIEHGRGKIILSTLILRSKASSDPVASRILGNMVAYADRLLDENDRIASQAGVATEIA